MIDYSKDLLKWKYFGSRNHSAVLFMVLFEGAGGEYTGNLVSMAERAGMTVEELSQTFTDFRRSRLADISVAHNVVSISLKRFFTFDEPVQEKKAVKDNFGERRQMFYNSLIPYVDTYGKEMVREFYNYWSEANKSQTKMKWELQKCFEIPRRLATWARNNDNYGIHNRAVGATRKESANSNIESTLMARLLGK